MKAAFSSWVQVGPMGGAVTYWAKYSPAGKTMVKKVNADKTGWFKQYSGYLSEGHLFKLALADMGLLQMAYEMFAPAA
jgi:hypothetical protein